MMKLSYTREAKLSFTLYKIDREQTIMQLAKEYLAAKFMGSTVTNGLHKWGLTVDLDENHHRQPSTINMLVHPELPYKKIEPNTTFREYMVNELIENNATGNFEVKGKVTRRASLGHVEADLDITVSLEWIENRVFDVPYNAKVVDVCSLIESDCFDDKGHGKITSVKFLDDKSQHDAMFLRSVPKTKKGATWVLVKTEEVDDEKERAKLITPKPNLRRVGRKRSLEFGNKDNDDINKRLKF